MKGRTSGARAWARWAAIAIGMLSSAGSALGQATTRESVSSGGAEGNGGSTTYSAFGIGARGAPTSVSAEGRFVAFASSATNLVPGDTDGVGDVFVHDRATGVTTRVSTSSAGEQANGSSDEPAISGDGRHVAFASVATNLVPAATIARSVFVHDRDTGDTSLVSVSATGAPTDGKQPSVSADGRFVAFASGGQVLVRDRAAGVTLLVSVTSTGAPANSTTDSPSISADGRFVAFRSHASDLVPGDSNGRQDVFVRDLAAGVTTRVSVDSAGNQGNQASHSPSLSADGRFVAFVSAATNFAPPDSEILDVFVHDRATGETLRASVDSAGVPADSQSELPSISADGRYVAFQTFAGNLAVGLFRGVGRVFVHDRITGQTTHASVSYAGADTANHPVGMGSTYPSISADGRCVAFTSGTASLVADDTNGVSDVFVRELRDPSACRAGSVNAGQGATADVLFVDGSAGDANRVVAVASGAPIEISLHASPSGPGAPGDARARYVLWVWPRFPSNPLDVVAGSATLGCTVDPTPFRPLASPQPSFCLKGTGLPAARVCTGLEVPAAAHAPWTRRIARTSGPATWTLQGILEDAGAANPRGFSVTNAVLVRLE
jgi:Tol biopolymer transport system component